MAGPTMSRLNVVTKAGDVTDLATGPHGLAVQLDAKFWVTSEAMLQSPGQILLGPTEDVGHDNYGSDQGR